VKYVIRVVLGYSILGEVLFGGTSHHIVKPPRFYSSEHRMKAHAIDRVYYDSINTVRVDYNTPTPIASTQMTPSSRSYRRPSYRRSYTPRSYYPRTKYPKATATSRAENIPTRTLPMVMPEPKAPEPIVDSTDIPKENRAVSLPLSQRYKDAPQIVSPQLEAYNISKISPFRDSTDKVMIESSSGNFAIPIAVLKTVSTAHFTPELLEQWNRFVAP